MTRRRIVCVVGPTATGKTALALEVARGTPVEVVSADSRQVYRGLDIGTAKPTAAERAAVLHHGLDLIDPDEHYDAARFATMATAAISAAHARGHGVLVVGGTGLYLRALTRGLCAAPPRAPAVRAALTARLSVEGVGALHRELTERDPIAAARIHPNDAVRIMRGLEVAIASGRPLSEWQREVPAAPAWDVEWIGLSLGVEGLDQRIAARVDAMIAAGWLDEVARLRTTVSAEAPAWRTVGYREWRTFLDGAADEPSARAAVVRATRQFAKRQRTWFRAESAIRWWDAGTQWADAVADVRRALEDNP